MVMPLDNFTPMSDYDRQYDEPVDGGYGPPADDGYDPNAGGHGDAPIDRYPEYGDQYSGDYGSYPQQDPYDDPNQGYEVPPDEGIYRQSPYEHSAYAVPSQHQSEGSDQYNQFQQESFQQSEYSEFSEYSAEGAEHAKGGRGHGGGRGHKGASSGAAKPPLHGAPKGGPPGTPKALTPASHPHAPPAHTAVRPAPNPGYPGHPRANQPHPRSPPPTNVRPPPHAGSPPPRLPPPQSRQTHSGVHAAQAPHPPHSLGPGGPILPQHARPPSTHTLPPNGPPRTAPAFPAPVHPGHQPPQPAPVHGGMPNAAPPRAVRPHQNNTQPRATPTMTSKKSGGNRNVMNLPIVPGEGREWSGGLCDFMDDFSTCCLATWCPCVVFSQNKARLEHLSSKGTPDLSDGGSVCSGDCCLYGCLCTFMFGWVLQVSSRQFTRTRYSVKGSGCSDCCTSMCCVPCALTQESQEIELEEGSFAQKR